MVLGKNEGIKKEEDKLKISKSTCLFFIKTL